MNVEVRKTPRAYGLLAQAAAANEVVRERQKDCSSNG
jgi:hypothetical protein